MTRFSLGRPADPVHLFDDGHDDRSHDGGRCGVRHEHGHQHRGKYDAGEKPANGVVLITTLSAKACTLCGA